MTIIKYHIIACLCIYRPPQDFQLIGIYIGVICFGRDLNLSKSQGEFGVPATVCSTEAGESTLDIWVIPVGDLEVPHGPHGIPLRSVQLVRVDRGWGGGGKMASEGSQLNLLPTTLFSS